MALDPQLTHLRARIDAIDDRVADLLVERLEIVREVGRVKADREAGRLALRLGREAQMLRRLLSRTAGGFPANGILRIWREIIANSTQIETEFGCVVDGTGGVDLHDLARDQVGSATPIETLANARAAIASLAPKARLLAVLAPPADGTWWPSALPADLAVVARLPLTELPAPRGFVVARMSLEPSGDDLTLVEAPAGTSGAVVARGDGRVLIEIPGFHADLVLPPGVRRLGGYATPLILQRPHPGDHA